jgi:hypothetical protein
VHLLVFKDTFIFRFYSILHELFTSFVRDRGGILVVERKDKTSRPEVLRRGTPRRIEVVLRNEVQKNIFDVGFKLTYLVPTIGRYTLHNFFWRCVIVVIG